MFNESGPSCRYSKYYVTKHTVLHVKFTYCYKAASIKPYNHITKYHSHILPPLTDTYGVYGSLCLYNVNPKTGKAIYSYWSGPRDSLNWYGLTSWNFWEGLKLYNLGVLDQTGNSFCYLSNTCYKLPCLRDTRRLGGCWNLFKRNPAGVAITLLFSLTKFINSVINSSPPGQNGRHFADGIFRCIVSSEKFPFLIQISLTFVIQLTILWHWFRWWLGAE